MPVRSDKTFQPGEKEGGWIGRFIPNPPATPRGVIPAEAARLIREHIAATGLPLLRRRRAKDETVLTAWNQDGDYDVTLPAGEWSPPFTTYREYAKYAGMKLREVMDEHGLERSELDNEMELDMIEQMVRPEDEPGAAALALLDELPACMLETETGLEAVTLWDVMDGGGPGSGYRSINVASAFELSLLQYFLDALERDTVIVLGR